MNDDSAWEQCMAEREAEELMLDKENRNNELIELQEIIAAKRLSEHRRTEKIHKLNAERKEDADKLKPQVREFIRRRLLEGLSMGLIQGEAEEVFLISRSTFYSYKKGMKK